MKKTKLKKYIAKRRQSSINKKLFIKWINLAIKHKDYEWFNDYRVKAYLKYYKINSIEGGTKND